MSDRVAVRAATAADEWFIKEMLHVAAHPPGRQGPSFEESMAEPRNRRFWTGFGRATDLGVIGQISLELA